MVQTISSLNWQPVAAANNEFAALVSIDTAVDGLWIITVAGAPSNAPDGSTILPNFVMIDNLANNGVVNISYGPFFFSVSQFSRKTFPIPQTIQRLTVQATVGLVGIAFIQSQYAPDDANFFAIQQAAGVQVLQYLPRFYNVTAAQVAADQASYTVFSPVAADITYTLIHSGTAPLASGWFQYFKNEGTKNVTIMPAGADVINGIYSALAPLILAPGDSGLIEFDGSEWHFTGHTSFTTSPQQPFIGNNGVLFTIPHKLGIQPQSLQPYMINTIAELNYHPGNIINQNTGLMGSFGIIIDATNLTLRCSNAFSTPASIQLRDMVSGAGGSFTPNNWNWYWRLDLWQ